MPHITVKMHKGRTEEQKRALADALTKAMMDTISCSEDHISLAIQEYEPSEWGEKVFYPEIMKNVDELYKKPNYKPE